MNKIVNSVRRLLIFNNFLGYILLSACIIIVVLPLPQYILLICAGAYIASTLFSFVRIFDKELTAIGKNRKSRPWRIIKIIGYVLANLASISAMAFMMLNHAHVLYVPFWGIAVQLILSFALLALVSALLGMLSMCCKDNNLDEKLLKIISLSLLISSLVVRIFLQHIGNICLIVSAVSLAVFVLYKIALRSIEAKEIFEFDINSTTTTSGTPTSWFATPQKSSLFGITERKQSGLKLFAKHSRTTTTPNNSDNSDDDVDDVDALLDDPDKQKLL